MKLKHLKEIIDHTITKLGEDSEIILQNQYGARAVHFDFGDEHDNFSRWSTTPLDTFAHVDGLGRFILTIKSLPIENSESYRILRLKESLKEVINLLDGIQ